MVTALISAGAALGGAIVGSSTTILTASGQYKRTARKEERVKENLAAENCRAKIARVASLTVQEQGYHEDEDARLKRFDEIRRLNDEVAQRDCSCRRRFEIGSTSPARRFRKRTIWFSTAFITGALAPLPKTLSYI